LCQYGGLSFLSLIGETEKSKVGGDDSHIVFGQKLKCEMVRCCDATTSTFAAKVRREVFAHFMHSPYNVIVVGGIDCLAFQEEFFVNNLIDVKENDEHSLAFVLHLPRLFSLSASLNFPCTAHASCTEI
jgi:hypothetical protein